MRLAFLLIVVLVGCGCAPMPVSRDRSSHTPPADEIERAAGEFRETLFAELSRRAADAAADDPGSWQAAQERWERDQQEARDVARKRLNTAIREAKGEQETWSRETWREIMESLSRGWK